MPAEDVAMNQNFVACAAAGNDDQRDAAVSHRFVAADAVRAEVKPVSHSKIKNNNKQNSSKTKTNKI